MDCQRIIIFFEIVGPIVAFVCVAIAAYLAGFSQGSKK